MVIVVGINEHYIELSFDGQYLDEIPIASSFRKYDETSKDPYNPKNSAFFGETVMFDMPTIIGQPISMVTIVKGKGITEFYDQHNDFQWKSINN